MVASSVLAPSPGVSSAARRSAAPKPVVFIDSGIGGLPYCRSFRALLPDVPVAYVADRVHFPYGSKGREELVAILVDLVADITARMDPRLVVVACNTASVSALGDLRSAFPDLPFVGTVPAVKPAALASAKRRIGVLATERTVNDPYAVHLAARFAPDCRLVGVAAPELVEFVERRYAQATPQERSSVAASYIHRFRELDVDSVVLGCTHFLFLADEFVKSGFPDISIFDSREGVARRAANLLSIAAGGSELLGSEPSAAAGTVFVTGDEAPATSWSELSTLFGLDFIGTLGGLS